ncbi:hypothetical protein ACHAQJ_002276 [Trichoderma viride]
MGNSNSSPESTDNNTDKKSLYRRYEDKKRGPGVTDEDILKYTGKTRNQLNTWAETQPGVAGNQPAGKLTIGAASGAAGEAAAGGLGGWGSNGTRKMKFPPQQKQPAKTIDDSDEED